MTHDQVWKALGDPTRRDILSLLRDGRKTTSELCDSALPLSRFAVMKHLGILERAGLVITKKEGQRRWNSLNAVPLREIYEHYVKAYESNWAEGLVALKHQVESRSNHLMKQHRIEQTVLIHASRAKVWSTLVHDVGSWWSHSFFEGEIHMESKAGGLFKEKFAGGEALYATVTMVKENEELRLIGPMGMKDAVYNSMRFVLEDADGGTQLLLTHDMSGNITDEIASGYTQGWTHLLGHGLKPLAESGSAG